MSNAAEIIIEKCGGHGVVAGICGVHITRVYRWTYPVEKGGTGGLIPTRHQTQLLKGARERGIDLKPEDFFSPELTSRPFPAAAGTAAEVA